MKVKNKIISLILFLIMVLNVSMSIINVFATENNISEVIKGVYSFTSNELNNIQLEDVFEYSDDCFKRSSFIGCEHLEILSAQLSIASASRYGFEEDHYEIDPSNNAYNIVNLLKDMKFEDVSTNKYYTIEKQENSTGVAVGHKTITVSGKEYTLLVIVPRSAAYKQEWAGDFIVGDGDIHGGFKAARDEILRYVKKYINENNISGDIKVWTTGHSRGAALANMIGGFFAGGGIEYFENKVSITPEDVYCYTYATPRTVKDNLDKNIELSVAGNRTDELYKDDTIGETFTYTKGGKVNVKDDVYKGIRNFISSHDIFPMLPPKEWGFTHYGTYIPVDHGVITEEAMLNELKQISPFAYNQYVNGVNQNTFEFKTFDLKTLSIVKDKKQDKNMNFGNFLEERMKGLTYNASTNKLYFDLKYEEALKSLAGVYGLAQQLFDEEISEDDLIEPLVFSYLAYASERLQQEEKATSENEAITIALIELLEFFTEEKIDKNTFTVDQFVELFSKYYYENENKPIITELNSEIVKIIPEDYKTMLTMLFGQFHKDYTYENPVSLEDGLKEFIKACYNGPDPESAVADSFSSAKDVRKLLYSILSVAFPDIEPAFINEEGNYSGEGSFENFIQKIVPMLLTVKDEDGNVINNYSNVAEAADDKLVNAIDKILENPIKLSEEKHNLAYKNALVKHVQGMKDNISELREAITYSLLYTESGFNVEEQIRNIATFIGNSNIVPLAHYNEINIAYAKATKYFDCGYEKHDIEPDKYKYIEGNNQNFNVTKDKKLSFKLNIDYDKFVQQGKIIIDEKEISRENYTITKGSTIITFNDDFTKTLSNGTHKIVAMVDDGLAETEFNITIENPQTGDNIMLSIIMIFISTIGLLTTSIYVTTKRVRNN